MPFPFDQYAIAFGIVSIILGFLGFVRSNSKASLIAGGLSGILLIVGALMMQRGSETGFLLAFIVSCMLFLRFLPNFLKTKKIYPAGIMTILALIAVILGVIRLVK